MKKLKTVTVDVRKRTLKIVDSKAKFTFMEAIRGVFGRYIKA